MGPPPTVHHSSCIHQAPVRSESEWWEGIDRAKAEKSDDLVPVDPDGDEGLLVPLGHLQALGGVMHGRDRRSKRGVWGGMELPGWPQSGRWVWPWPMPPRFRGLGGDPLKTVRADRNVVGFVDWNVTPKRGFHCVPGPCWAAEALGVDDCGSLSMERIGLGNWALVQGTWRALVAAVKTMIGTTVTDRLEKTR